jgi:hypothetical protein
VPEVDQQEDRGLVGIVADSTAQRGVLDVGRIQVGGPMVGRSRSYFLLLAGVSSGGRCGIGGVEDLLFDAGEGCSRRR